MSQLNRKLLQDTRPRLDKSHFLWLICYFLPFIPQLNLDVEHFQDVFSIDLLCHLTWEAVSQTEELEIHSFQSLIDVKPCVRRLHLVVKTIRDYLQTLERYCDSTTQRTGNGEKRIRHLCDFLPAIRDLRQVFLLQLRNFNAIIQSRRYLHDVITTNHVLLLTLERAAKQSAHGTMGFDMNQHLNKLCSRSIRKRPRGFQVQRRFCQQFHFDYISSCRWWFRSSWSIVPAGYSASFPQNIGRGFHCRLKFEKIPFTYSYQLIEF